MARGGFRPGSGRPPGRRNKVADAQKVIEDHVKKFGLEICPELAKMGPLDIMLRAMLLAAAEGKWVQAASIAKDAAPFCHPRLSSMDLQTNVDIDPSKLSDAELIALIAKDGGVSQAEIQAKYGRDQDKPAPAPTGSWLVPDAEDGQDLPH